ncbi:G2/M phase-specific E3 ubiquitin-protein ligase-like [Montipora foliosa]|uniref:G2/M phase-specific E3 ubiquitin-protein ligase-like n=1 Tax=Montipora foliosa TaxID=591990 RepID=UPI0035F1409F
MPKEVSSGLRLPALCTYNLKACQVIFKAVFGKAQVNREDVVKVLKKKFIVKQDRLTSLTMTQLMEVLAMKLVNQKYCSIKDGPETNITNLRMDAITVHKEIALSAGRKPYVAGNLVAWSILHGGLGPQCLSEDVFYLMLDQEERVVLARAVSAIVDESSAMLARELMESKTDDQLEQCKRINSDWLLDQGISTYKVDQNAMLGQIVKQALLYRVKSSIDLFLNGMDVIGGFLTRDVRKNPTAFLPLFTDVPSPLSVSAFKGLYVVKWSEEGSNNHAEEQDTIFCWERFLNQVAEGLMKDCQLEHVLMFITGADRVPPLGFGKPITIAFYDQDGEKRRPSSSTYNVVKKMSMHLMI